MVWHCVMFRWRGGTSVEQVRAVRDALGALPGVIPEIRAYSCGADLGLRDGNPDFAVVADFDDVDGFRTYVDHPAHRSVVTDLIEPICAERWSVQFAPSR